MLAAAPAPLRCYPAREGAFVAVRFRLGEKSPDSAVAGFATAGVGFDVGPYRAAG
jgi:hypothetical protein